MLRTRTAPRWLIALAFATAALMIPTTASAHASLVSSDPAGGSSVPGPLDGPVVLTFSEALRSGSHAELMPTGGAKVADAAIDPANNARLVFTLPTPLAPGSWTVQWTSIAQDRDVERGSFSFTVTAPTPSPTVPATAPPTLAPTAPPTPSPAATTAPPTTPTTASPTPSPIPTDQAPAAADVIVPVIAALALVAIAGAYLLRRGRGAG